MADKILVIDDERKIVDMITKFLKAEGFQALSAYDGLAGMEIVQSEPVDLVVLDVMLPGLDGFEVLQRIRSTKDIPVIMLTARTEEIDKLLGLGMGADDYITKPFSLKELVFRIRAVLRRYQKQDASNSIVHKDVTINPDTREVMVSGEKIDLTRAEFALLMALLSRPGKVFTREELLSAAFGEAYEGYERSIDTHIWNLRRKIEKDPSNPVYILTVFGIGYKGGQ
ncbi:MAG: response regulator transcription factor [Bacillota bacterium]|jgi:two-component system OmpR family response regulator